jgi:hypothetical protein
MKIDSSKLKECDEEEFVIKCCKDHFVVELNVSIKELVELSQNVVCNKLRIRCERFHNTFSKATKRISSL